LQKNDPFLLERKVHERLIAHKLAEYLQEQILYWNVDCEYNLKDNVHKSLKGIKERDEHKKTDRVYLDIIIHKRKMNKNLAVIEIKKNRLDPKCDIKKLELFIDKRGECRYSIGLFVDIEFENSQFKLKWFKKTENN